MTKPAAIQASYADYRRVKGRKVLQLVLEVPLEMAPQVHEAFGEPLPDGSTWVAVARIDPTAKPEKKLGGKLAQRAGILCGEMAFIKFLGDGANGLNVSSSPPPQTPLDAGHILRVICGVESRADLDHNTKAAEIFRDLELSFEAWKTL